MKKLNISIVVFLFISVFVASCKKDGFNGLTDVKPTIPVTVPNATEFRPTPAVRASKAAGGGITITLQVPSGHVINEITKVAASTNYNAVQNATTVGTSSSQLYKAGPFAGNGSNQITFTTSISEYMTRTGTASTPASNTELARQFYFVLSVDNGQVIIPEPVRVVVTD